MDKESRKEFETLFVKKMKVFYKENKNIKITKNKISFVDIKNKEIGYLFLQYIHKGKSYILHGGVVGGEVCHFIKEADPPYKSNLIADGYCLSFLSSNEKMKEFSDAIGGEQSQVPGETIDTFTDRIVDRITIYQVPRIMNCISGLPGLMYDVMKYPDEYNYPLIAFVYAAMKQGLSLNAPLVQEALQRRSMRGNKNFDNDFSQKWLSK